MAIVSDLRTLYHLTLAPIRGSDHRERLESFYAGQACDYDAFRAHLLQGRRELYQSVPIPDAGIWVELGGGTASNLEYLGDGLNRLSAVHVVDLSASLLAVAGRRISANGWSNVHTHQEDVAGFSLSGRKADVVTFSYSLTMVADWFAALENARNLLKPGGVIAVVDFYVARKYPPRGHQRHSWLTRAFWPLWLGLDNVFPSPDHVPYLHRHFEMVSFAERRARMRYFPLARVPYYQYVGRRPA